MDLQTAVTLLANGLALSAILFLLASGLTMIFGLLNIVNFAHGAFFLLGAYVGVEVFRAGGGENILLAFLAAAASVAVLGLVTERVLLQRFYHAETVMSAHLGQLLLTLGLTLIIVELVQIVKGPNLFATGPLGGFLGERVGLPGGGVFEAYGLVLIGVGLAVFLGVHLALQRTRTGLIVRAGVQDPEMVQALGVNVRRAFTVTFMVGSAMAGFAGLAAALYYKGAYLTLGEEHLVLAFGIVVLGGLGSYAGSAVGSLLVGLLTAYISYLWPPGQSFVVLALLAAVLLLRPQGIFGRTAVRV